VAVSLPLDLLKAALLLPVIRVIRRRGGLVAGGWGEQGAD
jgi:hypothetical protein